MAVNRLINSIKFSEVGHLNVEPINIGSQSDIQPLAFISPTTLYPRVKYVVKGDNVTFECAATGVPSPQLNWSFTASSGTLKYKHYYCKLIKLIITITNICIGNKHNTMLSKDETSINILSLIHVNTNASGTYTCFALQSMIGMPDFPHAQVSRFYLLLIYIISLEHGFICSKRY